MESKALQKGKSSDSAGAFSLPIPFWRSPSSAESKHEFHLAAGKKRTRGALALFALEVVSSSQASSSRCTGEAMSANPNCSTKLRCHVLCQR